MYVPIMYLCIFRVIMKKNSAKYKYAYYIVQKIELFSIFKNLSASN